MAPLRRLLVAFCGAVVFGTGVRALAETDTITWGGDVSRSGYQPNHNMDPAVVGSPDFGLIFKTKLPGNFKGVPEQIFSQPLVYTGDDGVQYVYIATTQNNIYKLNARSGEIVQSRSLHVPFLAADLVEGGGAGCTDINPHIGIIGTGVIDPSSGIWYFNAKTYSEEFQNGAFSSTNRPGLAAGRHWFHAVYTQNLTEAPNFPVSPQGLTFRNNPNRMLLGGIQAQRPALLHVGEYIYVGYGSHCVMFNFTGAVVGYHRTTGKIVEAYAMQGGKELNTVRGGGVWMSGGGLAYDGKGSMFWATGNGYASQLAATGQPVSGRNPPTALEEAVVKATIYENGSISVMDFFMPWEKTQLDGADKDLGTSPLVLLPSDTFTCANHKRIGVITGKSGKTYFLNLDSLGGYQMAQDRKDDVIYVYQNENSVYAGAGVMPLSGGYVYINVIQFATHVFKFSCEDGNAKFTLVGHTNEKNAYVLGVGHGTTTSLKGKEGSGLLWTSDVEGTNLRIYDAVPRSPGANLTLVNSFNVDAIPKFTRPVFGNGMAYLGSLQGYVHGFGSPVNLPLNCSSPYTFPKTPTGSSSAPITVSCVARTGTIVNNITLSGNANFIISDRPGLPLTLSAGASLSFNATFSPKAVGPLSSDVIINTSNNVKGFSSNTPISLNGEANSAAPLLQISPNTVSFNGDVVGNGMETSSAFFYNLGDSILTFDNITFSLDSETGPWITPNNTGNGTFQVGQFTVRRLPQTIQPNSAVTVDIAYSRTEAGNHKLFIRANPVGANFGLLDVFGFTGTPPSVLFEFEKPDRSGWVRWDPDVPFSFGNVTENTTRNLKLRVTNNGSSTAIPLSLTVSKPPYGNPGLVGAVNNVDLAEGITLAAGTSETATLYCTVPKSQVNVPAYNGSAGWTFNTGDPNLGKVTILFSCNAVAEQLGPLQTDGNALYGYVGCFRDNTPSRQLPNQAYTDGNNTNGRCIEACFAKGFRFAGTEYQRECWCGNSLPIIPATTDDCNFPCSGSDRQTCGGNGIYRNISAMAMFADSSRFDGNITSPPLSMVQSYGSYNYIGCYSENGAKTFNQKVTNANNMTVDYCGRICSSQSYPLFGLQYGAECYCGTNMNSLSSLLPDDSQCSMICKGSNSQFCGNGGKMQVYQLNGKRATLSSTATSSTTALGASSTSSAVSVTTLSSTNAASSSTEAISSTTLSSSASSTPSPTPTGPAVAQYVLGYAFVGCYAEKPGGRALTQLYANDSMTIDMCASQAASGKYSIFGVEYGRECWMGNLLDPLSKPADLASRCSKLCPGNPYQYCGNGNYLQLYNLTASSSLSSSTVSASIASATSAVSTVSSSLTDSASSTSAVVTTTGSTYTSPSGTSDTTATSSVPSSRTASSFQTTDASSTAILASSSLSSSEILTSSTLPASSSSSSVSSSNASTGSSSSSAASSELVSVSSVSTSSSMPTLSSSTVSSGSSTLSSAPSSSPITTSSASSSSASAATSTTAGTSSSTSSTQLASPTAPYIIQSVSDYKYMGCYTAATSGRALQAQAYANATSMTPQMCASFCSSYAWFGIEYGSECYCGPYPRDGSNITTQSDCNMRCPGGDKWALCGGRNRVTMYNSQNSSKVSTDPRMPPTSGNYTLYNCTQDGAPRLLTTMVSASDMSVDNCMKLAEAKSFAYAGVEYGKECWMGNALKATPVNATKSSECNLVCPGNVGQLCGAGSRLVLYQRNATT